MVLPVIHVAQAATFLDDDLPDQTLCQKNKQENRVVIIYQFGAEI